MAQVGLVLKRRSPEAREIARELATWLIERACEVYVSDEHRDLAPGVREVPETEVARRVELLVTLGGDGTLLQGAWLVGRRRVPLLAVNLGRLGFLTSFDPSEAREALGQALRGELTMEARMRLRVTLARAGGQTVERLALNDAVIAQGAMSRLIELVTSIDGDPITVYRADGLIICTPTGSTAYNLAAGGPIVTPGQSAMGLTPISPHTLTNRPLVVPATATVGVEVRGNGRVMLTVDGQWAEPVESGDHIQVTRADVPTLLYRSERSYFDILRQKLNWGS